MKASICLPARSLFLLFTFTHTSEAECHVPNQHEADPRTFPATIPPPRRQPFTPVKRNVSISYQESGETHVLQPSKNTALATFALATKPQYSLAVSLARRCYRQSFTPLKYDIDARPPQQFWRKRCCMEKKKMTIFYAFPCFFKS